MNPIQIIQGGKADFIVKFEDLSTGDPYDLTDVTTLTTCFTKADLTELMLALGTGISVVGSPLLGKIMVSLTSAQTTLLAQVEAATLEFTITLTGQDPFKKQIPMAYSVITSVC